VVAPTIEDTESGVTTAFFGNKPQRHRVLREEKRREGNLREKGL
jgi:hypothetical protein